MRPLLYSINVTLDGCVDHNAGPADETLLQETLRASHLHGTETISRADALLFGRVTYQMMEEAWRLETRTMTPPDWTQPFARTIDAMKKYVVSTTLGRVDWNAELLSGDLGEAVRKLKQQPGKALFTGGVTLPMALAELDLIDEYEFVVQPRIAGHGPTLFAGLSKYVELNLVDRQELSTGAMALRYEPRR
jgi:dihydrofolate reductase